MDEDIINMTIVSTHGKDIQICVFEIENDNLHEIILKYIKNKSTYKKIKGENGIVFTNC